MLEGKYIKIVVLALLNNLKGGEQNNGKTKKSRIFFVLSTLKELQFATVNVLFPLLYPL
jgi:hypothetical protein